MDINSIPPGTAVNLVSSILLFFTLLETRQMTKITLTRSFKSTVLIQGAIVWEEIVLQNSITPIAGIEVKAHHNIAYDIYGEIVINKKRYNLMFRPKDSASGFYRGWGWLDGESSYTLSLGINPEEGTDSSENNYIKIYYEDGLNNKYYFLLDENYKQTTNEILC